MTKSLPSLAAAILAVSVSACASEEDAPATDGMEAGAAAEADADVGTESSAPADGEASETTTSGGETADAGSTETPSSYSTGRPGQPAIPETVNDPDWRSRYSTEVTYRNLGDSPIPATLGASPRTGYVGSVQPGDGVAIITCEVNSTYCKVRFGEDGLEGYVNMDLLSGVAS